MLTSFNITNLTLRLLNNDKIFEKLLKLSEDKNVFIVVSILTIKI